MPERDLQGSKSGAKEMHIKRDRMRSLVLGRQRHRTDKARGQGGQRWGPGRLDEKVGQESPPGVTWGLGAFLGCTRVKS